MDTSAIILAAGAGTRMKSAKPKVAPEIMEKPLVSYVIDAAHKAGVSDLVAVLGHGRDVVAPLVEGDCRVVVQEQQRGTADAVNSCRELFEGHEGCVLVLSGDCPLITPETIARLVEVQRKRKAAAVVLTMTVDNPHGYGRIIRDSSGELSAIVEEKDATDEQRAIKECNSGFYCFDIRKLFDALSQVSSDNAQGEFYLTDVMSICREAGEHVIALPTEDADECLGINSRAQLAQAAKIMQRRINARHLDNGVSMSDPDLVWIGPDAVIEQDVELLPMTFVLGNSSVGSGTIVGPNSRLKNTVVGRNCVIDETVAIGAVIDDDCNCGPRAYLRPEAHLCRGAKAGTHVEIKKSTIGEGSKVPHLSYIGDATLGSNVNIGAGSITCNYDGKHKWPTTIGDDSFIGSDTMMVAPVNIGTNVTIGAGSVITNDVSDNSLGLGRARQVEIEGWALRKKEKDEDK